MTRPAFYADRRRTSAEVLLSARSRHLQDQPRPRGPIAGVWRLHSVQYPPDHPPERGCDRVARSKGHQFQGTDRTGRTLL